MAWPPARSAPPSASPQGRRGALGVGAPPRLSPPESLSGEREFRKVRRHGVALRDPLFTLRITEYRPRHGEAWRPRAIIGLVISKKTLRHATDRNRARRRVREALRTLPPELLPGGLPPCRAVLHPNPEVLAAPFADLQKALARALGRFNSGQGSGRKPVGQKPGSRKPEGQKPGPREAAQLNQASGSQASDRQGPDGQELA